MPTTHRPSLFASIGLTVASALTLTLALSGCATGPDPMSPEELAKRNAEWQRRADATAAAAVKGGATTPSATRSSNPNIIPASTDVASTTPAKRTPQTGILATPPAPTELSAAYKQLKRGMTIYAVIDLYPRMEKAAEGTQSTGPWSEWIHNDGTYTTRFRFEADILSRWNRTRNPAN